MKTDFSEYSSEQISSIQSAIDSQKTILLSANWGVGKTFFIRSLLDTKYPKKKIRYISLFGIETMDRLIQELINPQIDLEAKTIQIFNSTLPIGELNGFLNGGANLLIPKIKDEIIVLDDLERSSLDYTLILGLIDKLKIHNSIIFICNRNKIKDPEFLNQIEKVSDRIIDDVSIDFNAVMKKIIPANILNDVLYSFFILKEDNLRIAIKLGQYFNIIKTQLPYLSYKDVRLFSCLAIEKIKHGYLNQFYDMISVDPFKKIESYIYDREVRINKNAENNIKMKQDIVEVKTEELEQEYELFSKFIKKISDEDFYHIKPSLIALLRNEFLDEKAFVRQTWNSHPAFKSNNLPNEILYPKDLVDQSMESAVKELNSKILNAINNFGKYITKDPSTDFNVLYHMISSYFAISEELGMPSSTEIKMEGFAELIHQMKDEELNLVRHPHNNSQSFNKIFNNMSLLIENEKQQRDYKKLLNILTKNDEISFYKNNYNDTIIDYLNNEFLDIILNNYISGSKLSKDIISILLKDSYMGDKKDKSEEAGLYLKTALIQKEQDIKDIFIKKRINKLLENPNFTRLTVQNIPKPEKRNFFKLKVSESEYLAALENIKKEAKDSEYYNELKDLIFRYKSQLLIDKAASKEYEDYQPELKAEFLPGDKVMLTSKSNRYLTTAQIGGIYTLKAKSKYSNASMVDLKLWTTLELEDSLISESNIEKVK